MARIAELHKVPAMLDKANLEKVLQHLVEASKQEFDRENDLGGTASIGAPISANDIPDGMHRDVVDFVRRLGFQPQHGLERWEEEYFGAAAMFASLFPRRESKIVKYNIWQSSDLPNSAAILEIPGDGQCIPTIKVLLYEIPLQLTICLLVSSFRHGWPPRENDLELLCHSYKTLKPGMAAEAAKTLASFAAKRTMEKLRQCVEGRVAQLEKELQQ